MLISAAQGGGGQGYLPNREIVAPQRKQFNLQALIVKPELKIMEGTKQLHTKVQVMSVEQESILQQAGALRNLFSSVSLMMISTFATMQSARGKRSQCN